MKTIDICPVCNHSHFVDFLSCKDYFVSAETFRIVSCSSCGFKFTNPRPLDARLGKYYKSENYISHSNTKKGLVSRTYQFVRTYTLRQKEKLLRNFVARGTILDYGCGTGHFLDYCKRSGWEVNGIEPDNDAQRIGQLNGLDLQQDKDSFLKSHPNKKFDAITLWHVLEHVTDLKETLDFIREALKENGALFIAVPNYRSYDANIYKEYWAAYDLPRHLYHFDKDSITNLLKRQGFELKQIQPMRFDSFYVSLLSEKYKHSRTRYLAAIKIGLLSNIFGRRANNYSSLIYIFKKSNSIS